jgi:hypothetical protein
MECELYVLQNEVGLVLSILQLHIYSLESS